jgi:hypothetical protein
LFAPLLIRSLQQETKSARKTASKLSYHRSFKEELFYPDDIQLEGVRPMWKNSLYFN